MALSIDKDVSRTVLDIPPQAQPGVIGKMDVPQPPQYEADSMEVDETLIKSQGLSEAMINTLSQVLLLI